MTMNEWLFIAPIRIMASGPITVAPVVLSQAACFHTADIAATIEVINFQVLPVFTNSAQLIAWVNGGAK